MATSGSRFELPGKVEHYLGILSKVYKREGKNLKLSIIVNARINVIEGTYHDNWNGGIDGHSVILTFPQDLFLSVLDNRAQLESEICKDINKLHTPESEHIADVTFEMLPQVETDWRLESGAMENPRRTIAPERSTRIWGDSGFRVFFSHKSEVKKQTAALKESLKLYGIASFVAHEDIAPTKEWQNEIEAALESMDAFVALLTKEFHESLWTDQEVGYAFARGVPIIAVGMGRDPYGFIGKFQGLRCTWAEAPNKIASLLIKHSRMLSAFNEALPKCRNFDEGLKLALLLPEIESLTLQQADQMMKANNMNPELSGCWGFSGAKGSRYGKGLAYHLSRLTGRKYSRIGNGQVERSER
jgi:hypothetical protein